MNKITPEWLDSNLPAFCKKYTVMTVENTIKQVWRKIDGVWTDVTERELAIEQAKRDVVNAAKEREAYDRKLTADEKLSEAIDDYILNAREHLYD